VTQAAMSAGDVGVSVPTERRDGVEWGDGGEAE
jgi:hypothetical protein